VSISFRSFTSLQVQLFKSG